MASGLRVGMARADITPPVGIPMIGFAGRGTATDIHDPLYATAMAVCSDSQQAVLIGLDLVHFEAETVSEFRRAIEDGTGIPPDRITLACSHSHYGPDVAGAGDSDPVEAYRNHLKYQLAGIVQEALQDLRPATLGVGWGCSDIGVNRRERLPDGGITMGQNLDGPVDRQVGVARIDDAEGGPIACLVNFATHPVCMTGQIRSLSADYPGSMRQVVEGLTGARCLFLQGAAGDINPVTHKTTKQMFSNMDSIPIETAYEFARSLGTRLGCEVVRVWETIAAEETTGLDVASRTVLLPRYMYDSLEDAEQFAQELKAEFEAGGLSEGRLYWVRLMLERVQSAIGSYKTGEALPGVEAELQAWRIGDLGLATAPAEIFTENGTFVKQNSPFEDTFFSAYTNGRIGYVPTREAYREGGYEVRRAGELDPEAGDLINEGCLDLLREIHET